MIINHNVVMTCIEALLLLICEALEVRTMKAGKRIATNKLRAVVGTKLANSATLSSAYASDTLDHEQLCNAALNAYVTAQADAGQADAGQADAGQADAGQADAGQADAGQADAGQAGTGQAGTDKRAANVSAKQWLIDLLSAPNASYTLAQLIALTGKTEVNIRTMLSDLRSAKYAGKYGVFNTKSVRINGVTHYSKA